MASKRVDPIEFESVVSEAQAHLTMAFELLAPYLVVLSDDERLSVPRTRTGFLEAGRKLAQEAEAASASGGEHAQLVRFEVASGALLRYVASLPAGDARAAEAYYWLGVIESRVGRTFWLSQTEPYLEAAIRLDPGDPRADKAYALLEEFVVGGYTGSSGEHVPADVRAQLDDLKRLTRN